MGSSRLYDPEAVNIFGHGHLTLQVEVSLDVVVVSAQNVWLEIVSDAVKKGFRLATGGQSETGNRLQDCPQFYSLQMIQIANGLSPSQSPPTLAPTHWGLMRCRVRL